MRLGFQNGNNAQEKDLGMEGDIIIFQYLIMIWLHGFPTITLNQASTLYYEYVM